MITITLPEWIGWLSGLVLVLCLVGWGLRDFCWREGGDG